MLVCQELFDDKNITSVTVQTSGGKPNGGFNITYEYIVFITPKDFEPNANENSMNDYASPYHGMNLATFDQVQRPGQTYPIYVDKDGIFAGCGKSLTERVKTGEYTGELKDFVFRYDEAPEGTVAIWPVTKKGIPCVWRLIPSRLKKDWEKGYIKIIPQNPGKTGNLFAIQYLSDGIIKKIKSGELSTHKISENQRIPTIDVDNYRTAGTSIQTIWTAKEFYTTNGGNEMADILGDKKAFSYPKPLALITEIIQRTTNSESIVLDFFAGSGTAGHAVLKLNEEDGGNRRFILCTNNENNICEAVTYERIKRVISGYGDTAGIPTNLKYYRTDFVAKDAEDISEALLAHIAEMIQLEHGVKLDGKEYLMVMSDDEADALEQHWADYPNVKALYVSKNVLLTTAQNALFRNAEIHIIPDNYFKFELKEVGEAW